MKLPEQVKEFKAHLEKVKDRRLKTFRLLTEAKDLSYEEYLERMWKSILREEKKLGKISNNEWVSLFLNSVVLAMEEKPYYSMNGETRREYLNDIKKHSKHLTKIYQRLGLDEHFFMYDPEIFRLYDETGNQIIDADFLPTAGISEALSLYQDYAKEEIGKYAPKGKLGKRHKSIRFIRDLGKRNNSRYGQPLLSVLSESAFAIYDEKHDDVSNLLNERRKKTG